ncbi:hypothetical protein DUI87_07057 [Hirundo rustica rustica]|uniref:Uncharacterized protein n=1 Tax=Hirundo rustica rustica TaxID=333673 RepID=A0A3M0KVS8_HIRRU|nr:hypothetical protein DUI87_07057 [Hirundo rustica rustica]
MRDGGMSLVVQSASPWLSLNGCFMLPGFHEHLLVGCLISALALLLEWSSLQGVLMFMVINTCIFFCLADQDAEQVQRLFMGRVLVLSLTFAVSWLDNSSDILM